MKPIQHLQRCGGHVTPAKGTAQGRQGNNGGFAADVSDGLSIPDMFLSHAADLLSLGSVLNRF